MEKVNDVVIPIFSDPYGSMFKYAHAPDGTFNDGHGKYSYKIHSGPEDLKNPGQKNSRNQIIQFHEIYLDQIPFFAISKMTKNQFLNRKKI